MKPKHMVFTSLFAGALKMLSAGKGDPRFATMHQENGTIDGEVINRK